MSERSLMDRFRNAAEGRKAGGQGLVLALILSFASLVAVCLLLIWLNIERTKLAYKARTLQYEVERVRDLNSKLSVERESLLSPSRLGATAQTMGLGPAKAGQIRRMDERRNATKSK
jgi:hypothetical protein